MWHVLGAGSKKGKKKHSGVVFFFFLICSKDESICIEIWLKYRKHQGRQVERSKGENEASVEGETKNPYCLRFQGNVLKPNLIGPPLLKLLHFPVEFSVMMKMFHNALTSVVSPVTSVTGVGFKIV